MSQLEAQPAAAVVLRRATPEDRADLVAMYSTFEPKGDALGLPPAREPECWLDKLAGYLNLVAFVGSRLAGHGVLCAEGDPAEVSVFVHQDYRGQGLGKKLLSELIEEGRRRGLRRLWGVTEPDNIPMLRLAQRMGFVAGEEAEEFYLDLQSSGELRGSKPQPACILVPR